MNDEIKDRGESEGNDALPVGGDFPQNEEQISEHAKPVRSSRKKSGGSAPSETKETKRASKPASPDARAPMPVPR